MATDDKINDTSAVPLTTDAAGAPAGSAAAEGTLGGKEEAKSRFNSALDEAKAGAQALRGEASQRAQVYKEQAAAKIDDYFGPKYGDHARNAARGLQDAASHIDTKSSDELGDEARQFVRKNPGLSVGLAAFGGYVLARMFRR